MSDGLYQRHRPTKLSEIVGQDAAVSSLKGLLKSKKFPHAVLFSGPSGTGKTTLARICAKYLKAHPNEIFEHDCGLNGGIDAVRSIKNSCGYPPMRGNSRIFYIDEAHRLSPQAQEGFLKSLEDGPEHSYFFLATTLPEKLNATIRTRTTHINLAPVDESVIRKLIVSVLEKEELELEDEIIALISENCSNSPRQSLVILEQVLATEDLEHQKVIISSGGEQGSQAYELAKAICSMKSNWGTVAKLIKDLKEDPEATRWVIMGYANAILLNQKNSKNPFAKYQHKVIECMSEPFFNTKKNGLTKACFEIMEL